MPHCLSLHPCVNVDNCIGLSSHSGINYAEGLVILEVGRAGANRGKVNDFYAGKKGGPHKFMHAY